MGQEVVTTYTSGFTLYFHIYNSSGLFWNGTTFVTKNNANWATYANTLTETPTTGSYAGIFPASIGPGIYYMLGYVRLGGSPAPTDSLVRAGAMDWNGTEEFSGGASGGGSSVQQSFTLGSEGVEGELTTGIVYSTDDSSIQTGVE